MLILRVSNERVFKYFSCALSVSKERIRKKEFEKKKNSSIKVWKLKFYRNVMHVSLITLMRGN